MTNDERVVETTRQISHKVTAAIAEFISSDENNKDECTIVVEDGIIKFDISNGIAIAIFTSYSNLVSSYFGKSILEINRDDTIFTILVNNNGTINEYNKMLEILDNFILDNINLTIARNLY